MEAFWTCEAVNKGRCVSVFFGCLIPPMSTIVSFKNKTNKQNKKNVTQDELDHSSRAGGGCDDVVLDVMVRAELLSDAAFGAPVPLVFTRPVV